MWILQLSNIHLALRKEFGIKDIDTMIDKILAKGNKRTDTIQKFLSAGFSTNSEVFNAFR